MPSPYREGDGAEPCCQEKLGPPEPDRHLALLHRGKELGAARPEAAGSHVCDTQ